MDVYIVLGYLGSGKTTFIKRAMSETQGKRTALIVNDFGDDVDGNVLERSSDIVYKIEGGSIFCNCKSHQFVEALINVAKDKPDMVIVETSGMANPFTMIDILNFVRDKFAIAINLKPVISFVDASVFERYVTTVSMIKLQIQSSDLVVINKCDLCSETQALRVEELIKSINAGAVVVRSAFADISLQSLASCEIIPKNLGKNVVDLTAQKIKVMVKENTPVSELDAFSAEAIKTAHRIKGKIMLGGEMFAYEYLEDGHRLQKIGGTGIGFLTILAVTRQSLQKCIGGLQNANIYLENLSGGKKENG